MARKKAGDNKVQVGDIHEISGEVTIAAGDIYKGFTAEQVSVLITQITSTFQPKPFDGRRPYKGLDVFEEEDAELFFGREKLVEDLVSRVKESRTVFVTGPSGSGKSSLVRAGLIHALKQGAISGLRSDTWLYATITPGRDPIEALAGAFSRLKSPELGDYVQQNASRPEMLHKCAESVLTERKDQRLALFIDQFEEVFTQLSVDKTETFINLLAHTAAVENGRVIILFAMRSDFVSNCATYPQLNALLNRQFIQIGAMQPDELVSAIAQPALRVGLRIDPDLIAQIINDMQGEPGALPLMQFALKDLFDAQQAKGGVIELTLNDYLERGGIHKALERHADNSFNKLDSHEQELARSIFTGLIEIGRGTQDTRRTALFIELVPASSQAEDVQRVMQKLADARLVTTEEKDSNKYTITHEKLLDAWPWLKRLVNENRDVIALKNEIAGSAKEWDDHKRDPSYLYTGVRLANARKQVGTNKLLLSGSGQSFIDAGVRAYTDELFVEKNRTAVLRRQRQFLLISGALIFIAIYLVAVSRNREQEQRQIADSQKATAQAASTFAVAQQATAQANANIALARQLAAQAQSISVLEPESQTLWGLLGVESMNLIPSFEASLVLQNIRYPHHVLSYDYNTDSLVFSLDGKYLAGNEHGTATTYVWDVESGKEITKIIHEDSEVSYPAPVFSSHGRFVMSVGCEISGSEYECLKGDVIVWDLDARKEAIQMTYPGVIYSAVFSPDSHSIAISGCEDNTFTGNCSNGLLLIWEAITGKELARIMTDNSLNSVAFDPSGVYLVTGSSDGTAQTWDARTGREISKISLNTQPYSVSVAFCSDGQRAVSKSLGEIQIWNAFTGIAIIQIPVTVSATGATTISPNCYLIVESSDFGISRVRETNTGDVIAQLKTNDITISNLFSPSGKYVADVGPKSVQIWEVGTWKKVFQTPPDDNLTTTLIAFSPDEHYLASGAFISSETGNLSGDNENLDLWEFKSGNQVAHMQGDIDIISSAISKDGLYMVSTRAYDSASVWEIATGKEISSIAHDTYLNSVDFSPDGKYVASGSLDRTARVWNAASGKEVTRVLHDDSVNMVAFSADGRFVVSNSDDSRAHIWETTTGKVIFDNIVKVSAMSPDRRWLAIIQEDNALSLLDLQTPNTPPRVLQTYPDEIHYLRFSPDGEWLATINLDNNADIWHFVSDNEIMKTNFDGIGYSIYFCSDGKQAALSRGANIISFRELITGKEIAQVSLEKDILANITPDCKYIILRTPRSNIIRVWDVSQNAEAFQMRHENEVTSFTFSSDGRYIASSGGCNSRSAMPESICPKGTLRVWELDTGKEVARLPIEDAVYNLYFSSGSKYIIGLVKRALTVWIWRPEDQIKNACSRLPSNLTRAEWEQYIGDALPYQAVCENLPIEPSSTATP